MDRFSPARIHLRSHLVARHATINLATVLGVPYSMRPALSVEQDNALLGAKTRAQEIAEGIACEVAFRRYGDENPTQDPVPFQNENEDPVRVCKILRKLVEFERKQIETEDFIIQELEHITAAVLQLQHNAQFAQQTQAQAQARFNAQAQVPDYFDGIPDPYYIDNSMVDVMSWEPSVVIDLALWERIAERLFNVHERIAEDVLGEWKQSQLYNDTWIWPECPIIYGWLKQVVELGLSLYALSPTSVFTDRVLTNIFNDTFLLKSLSSRFIVYCPKQQRHNAGIEFRHLLGEFFNPEATPVISVVNEEQVQSSFTRAKDSGSCANVGNNVGQVRHEGPTNLIVKFENLKIAKRERPGRRVSGDTSSQGRVSREKYWLLCEMNVHVLGWKSIKLTALSPSLVILSNTNQIEAAIPALQFENAGFSRRRDNFFAPRELDCGTVLDSLNWLTMAKLQKPLSEVNKRCLDTELRRVGSPNGKVTLEQMSPTTPHDTNPSFFEFYYGFVELVNQYFRDLWDNGLVMGWITREHLQTFLQSCAIGTLLIRPAFRVKKGVTISWTSPGGIVHSLDPWTDQDLKAKGLVARIDELSSQFRFSCIYPDYPAWMLNAPQNAPLSPPPSPPMEDEGNVSPPVRRPPGYVIVMPMLVYPSQRALSV